MTLTINQNNIGEQLLTQLLGDTAGLSNFKVKLTGDARAFGEFQDDPFGLESGVVISTGKVTDLAGENTADGGFSPGSSIPLKFTQLPGKAGPASSLGTGIFYADLSTVGTDINSILFSDSGSVVGGASGRFSGFDLDSIRISPTLITSAADIDNTLPTARDVFDFSPAGTIFSPGVQRPPTDPANSDLFGTISGNINNSVATLEQFDAFNFFANDSAFGAASLGDGGKVGFNLKNTIPPIGTPLYLYVGEAANNGETPDGKITVSNRPISGLSDLSTDFGLTGEANDTISLEINFDADATAQQLFFQYVFGSEELVEFGGQFNDAFGLELNGFNLAQLTDGSAVTINNLVSSPTGPYSSDFIYNPANTGPASSETKLDGYTKPLTFTGNIEPDSTNSLVITIKDTRDGLFDSAAFIKGGTFGTSIPPKTIDGSGGNQTIDINPSDGTVVIDNFGGVGRGIAPSPATIAEADTLKFTGAGLTAKNMLLAQIGSDLEISFEGIASPKVILKNFWLENLDNLQQSTGATVDLGNILFEGQTTIADSFDVSNAEWTLGKVMNPNTVTFLNDLDNTTQGFNTDDVINGQGGSDRLNGLKGSDLLRGGEGNDILSGDAGNDVLVGGSGFDLLTGGSGSDRFALATAADGDTITDFQVGQDLLSLTNGLSVGALTIAQGSGINVNNTLISVTNSSEVLAILIGVQASTITPLSFSTYPL